MKGGRKQGEAIVQAKKTSDQVSEQHMPDVRPSENRGLWLPHSMNAAELPAARDRPEQASAIYA